MISINRPELPCDLYSSQTKAEQICFVEYLFWETYQNCARDKKDPRFSDISRLVLLVKERPEPVAQILYRLAYAIFAYAVTRERSYLEQTLQQCCINLELLQASYSVSQINKYLSNYMTQQNGVDKM